ncbi:MAG: CopG family transcriptional regulator [Rhodospirillaceae bacterium]
MKARYQLYLSPDKSRRLETLCLRKGSCKSAILEAALDAYLDRQGANELDDRLGVRLQRLERNQEVVAESLALFVQHYLTVTAPMPDVDDAALAIGRERFDGFRKQVLRQLAGGGDLTFDALNLRPSEGRA